MVNMKITFWTSFFMLIAFWAAAQKANFQFYNTDDGLSGNVTLNIAQDREGYLWVTNDYKLHRFDGRQFLKQPLCGSVKQYQNNNRIHYRNT
jgi:ligand-binding sensor domain-containing protein